MEPLAAAAPPRRRPPTWRSPVRALAMWRHWGVATLGPPRRSRPRSLRKVWARRTPRDMLAAAVVAVALFAATVAAMSIAARNCGRTGSGCAAYAAAGSWGRPGSSGSVLGLRGRRLLMRVETTGQKCPSCGRAQRVDCNGYGKLTGGIGNYVDWVPVKAYRQCPRFKGSYKRRGQKVNRFFDEELETKAKEGLLRVPATWRALTRIKLREFADVKAEATGDMVNPYEKFTVLDVIKTQGQHFLRLEDKNGWAFDKGIAGRWVGKPIAERIKDGKEGSLF
mmetsp:Transcript_3429/g.8123  ORF Transcript_3429/g.8123 Transcript_3429/m.8123 type:complete len:280 (-) Transcript_3429:41-880(-)